MREMPHNVELEVSVIAAVLLNTEQYGPEVFGNLKPQNFYDTRNRTIFAVIEDLYNKGRDFDTITVANRLEEIEQMDRAGGRLYLSSISDSIPMSLSISEHVEILSHKGMRRDVIGACEEIALSAYDERVGVDELQAKCEDVPLIFTSGGTPSMKPLSEVAHGAHEEMLQALQRGYRGTSSGLSNIDTYTRGFQPGIYVIAGRPGMGKSTLMLDMAYRQAAMKHPDKDRMIIPGIVSIEMSSKSLFKRLVSRELGRQWDRVKPGVEMVDHTRELTAAVSRVSQRGVVVDDNHHSSIQTVVSSIFKMILRHKVDIVYIDYIQLLGNAKSSDNREQEVASVMRRLVEIRKKFEIPVVVLAQLNRECEAMADRRPMLSHLRESGSIEQDADVVMFLYDPKEYFETDCDNEVIIAKNRDGPTGTAYVNWDRSSFTFGDVTGGFKRFKTGTAKSKKATKGGEA